MILIRTVPFAAVLLLGAGLLVGGCEPEGAEEETTADMPPDSVRTHVEREIAALNDLRESLAATIDTPSVTKETFNRVCKPIGVRAKEISAENGWMVRQVAKKYRNPAHALNSETRPIYDQFASSPEKMEAWSTSTRAETEGWLYARRITVQSSCLACHGSKEDRPEFVKTGYPDDRAYGFEEGDLRGLYTVFVPAGTSRVTSAVDPGSQGRAP